MFAEGLKGLSNSLKAHLYDRVSNPLFICILCSWFFFNWESFIYFMLSEAKVEDKLVYIKDNHDDVWINVIYPILYGSFFCLIYPIVSFIPFYLWEFISSRKRLIKSKFSIVQPLSIKQSMAIRDELKIKEVERREMLEDYSLEQENFKRIISRLNTENRKLIKLVSNYNKIDLKEYIVLSEDQELVLQYISDSDQEYITAENLVEKNNQSFDYVSELLNVLMNKSMIQTVKLSHSEEVAYKVSSIGSRYLST